MEALLSILSGGLGGGLLVWLLRSWISERLKQSVRHEYSQKLETHKAELKAEYEKQLELYRVELNSRMEAIRHQYELDKQKRSLFFDHQREAFASLLSKIAEVKKCWIEAAFEPYVGLTKPVPGDQYQSVLDVYYENQLFLDDSCLAAVELVLEALRASLPYDDGSGNLRPSDIDLAYDRLEYLQPRVGALFQYKLGVGADRKAEYELALLGSILLLNRYHFRDIGLPVKGKLKLDARCQAADAVIKAENNKLEMLVKLKEFHAYLREGHGTFHETAMEISRYLTILNEPPNKPDAGDVK